ncbi:MAG: zinc ribbon domain-containing protein [Leptospirales bacterium]
MADGHSVQGTLSLVYRLQTMDVEVLRLTLEIQEASGMIEVARLGVEDLERQIGTSRKELEDLETRRAQIDIELRETERLLVEGKKRQKELKHPRDIQAYLSEMEFRRDEKDRFEEEILHILENQDLLRKKTTELEETFLREKNNFETLLTGKGSQIREWNHRIEDLHQERIDVEQSFPEDLLKTYNRLRISHRNGMVVARLVEGACEACRMSQPPRTVTEVKKRQRIVACLFCQRWLYLPNQGTEGEAVFHGTRTQGTRSS